MSRVATELKLISTDEYRRLHIYQNANATIRLEVAVANTQGNPPQSFIIESND